MDQPIVIDISQAALIAHREARRVINIKIETGWDKNVLRVPSDWIQPLVQSI